MIPAISSQLCKNYNVTTLEENFRKDLDAWINNPNATGNKQEAAKKIIEAFHNESTELYLHGLCLNLIPDAICNLQNLKEIYLGNNQLSTIPNSIGHLQNLKALYLGNNQLSTIPDAIGNLQSLKELDLENNQLSIIPDAIFNLQSLKELDLENNQLSIIPDAIFNLQSLKELALENNQLSTIPDAICSLRNLKRLDLDHNKLSTIPDAIGKLQNLEVLSLQNNNLSTIPDAIYNLQSLEWLFLQNNNLSTIPNSIGHLQNLEVLYLQNNNLSTIPDAICNLQNLKELYLVNNQLSTIPDAIFNLQNLELLTLHNNQLTSIPQSIGECLSLRSFNVENNPQLEDLPMSLGNLPNLIHFDVVGTSIPQERVDTILDMCSAKRASEAGHCLPQQLNLWSSYAEIDPKSLNPVLNFTDQEKIAVYEWLIRLTKCADFSKNQKELAKTACAILQDATQNEIFKETFIAQIIADNAECGDRAAMGLNVLYVSWCILCPKKTMSVKEQLELLTKAGKTLALRKALGEQMQEYKQKNPESLRESTEIYLFYEIDLKESLGLLTVIQSMLHDRIGKRDWIDVERLKSEVQKNYLDQVIDLSIFEKLLNADSSAVMEVNKIQEEYVNKLENCKDSSNMDLVIKEREDKLKTFKKQWLFSKLQNK